MRLSGEPLLVGVDCAGDERRLRGERERERVERAVVRAERRRLRDFAALARRRRLPFREAIDLVVEQQDLHRDVAPQRVDQVVAADRERVAVAGDDPDREVGRVVARPVASAGARPWMPCIPYVSM
jgi:hypothetical protein